MSRRKGQCPTVRVGKRADGQKYFYFQYWVDVPGIEERQRKTEVLGLVRRMTKSEAERKKLEFISNLKINSNDYQIPSSATFSDAVKHYRAVHAPRMLRASTISTAEVHLKVHLEPDWRDTPIEHIDIDAVNEWIWKKRKERLSWVTIKNIVRTLQRVCSAFSKDRKPPFSQNGLAIPESDKIQMKRKSREAVSLSWAEAKRIAKWVRVSNLDDRRKEQYSALFLLASASGLRFGELAALKMNDLDFKARTIRVDESSDQRNKGDVGPCKNIAAYRTVLLADNEGREALNALKQFVDRFRPDGLVFQSRRGTPLLETNVLHDGLHPALRALGFAQAGMHAFRHGCNRRWELAGLNPAILRQQMGHSSETMTARYTGEIPIALVKEAFAKSFSSNFGNEIVVLEKMENEVAA
jgi:integrase